MAAGTGSGEMRVVRLTGISLATIAFAVFLLMVNYPYALHWLP